MTFAKQTVDTKLPGTIQMNPDFGCLVFVSKLWIIDSLYFFFFSVIQASHEFLNGDTLITDKGPDGINITR